jgi:phosphoribosylanthranilate isomerase
MQNQPLSSAPPLQIKVCGLNEPANLAAVAALTPDFVGLIFAGKSPRHALALDAAAVRALPAGPRKVGVFVDATTAEILSRQVEFRLNAVQLHGHETPAQCAEVRAAGLLVIKAFGVGATFDFAQLAPYVPVCDYFLFDTQGARAGGNGLTFDWSILESYPWSTPYLLAGGLTPAHAEALRALRLPGLAGVDLNSGFETKPGLKDASLLQLTFNTLRAS